MKPDPSIPISPLTPSALNGPTSLDPHQAFLVPTSFLGGVAADTSLSASDPEAEYWQENHFAQPYGSDGDYVLYESAYRVGYEGFRTHSRGTSFADAESELRDKYESLHRELPWIQARRASLAAWQRAYEHQINPNFRSE